MSYQVIPELHYLHCDLCHVTPPLWDELQKRFGDVGNIFFGTDEQALAAGWQERDFGHICLACIKKEADQEALDEEQQAESFVGKGAPTEEELAAAYASIDYPIAFNSHLSKHLPGFLAKNKLDINPNLLSTWEREDVQEWVAQEEEKFKSTYRKE